MPWLDPPECTAAQDALARGNPVEAAQTLLACCHQHHRRVRQLRVEIAQALVRQAQELVEAGQPEPAQCCLQLAQRCAALQPQALALQQQIEDALQARRQAGEVPPT